MKRNHHFSGKPFAGKAADYPDKCRGGSSGSSGGGLLGSGSSRCEEVCNEYCKNSRLCNFAKCENDRCFLSNDSGIPYCLLINDSGIHYCSAVKEGGFF